MSSHLTREKTVVCGCVINGAKVLLASSADAISKEGYDLTYVFSHDSAANGWSWTDYDWTVTSVCLWLTRQVEVRAVLSHEGESNLYGPGGIPDHTFQILGAGVLSPASAGLGYVNRIRSIGPELFVCGQSRQVYRFEFDGRDLASGVWRDIAGPMRRPPMPEPDADATDSAFERWLDVNDAVDFVDMDGTHADDIYATGDETWHWNGQTWSQLQLPTDEPIHVIRALNPKEICLAGHNGTLLMGNAQDGFVELSSVDDNQLFTGVEWFEDRLFLASNMGLFTYAPADGHIRPYRTSMSPDLQDTHLLEAKDGVLWSFGFKDLAFFDGKTWTRVDHPDNPPIR